MTGGKEKTEIQSAYAAFRLWLMNVCGIVPTLLSALPSFEVIWRDNVWRHWQWTWAGRYYMVYWFLLLINDFTRLTVNELIVCQVPRRSVQTTNCKAHRDLSRNIALIPIFPRRKCQKANQRKILMSKNSEWQNLCRVIDVRIIYLLLLLKRARSRIKQRKVIKCIHAKLTAKAYVIRSMIFTRCVNDFMLLPRAFMSLARWVLQSCTYFGRNEKDVAQWIGRNRKFNWK